jgi:hypothetical protein
MSGRFCMWARSFVGVSLCASLAIACSKGGGSSNGGAGSGASGSSAVAGSASAGIAGANGANIGGSSGVSSNGAGGSGGASSNGASGAGGVSGAGATTTFFVTSDTSKTGNLGGLSGADARCQALAVAAGIGAHTFHAYLSVEHDVNGGNMPVNARDRIGAGPWYNALGALLAPDVTALHALNGDPELFLDEKGRKINGQYAGSATPLEHDILTGSSSMGTVLAHETCADWSSTSATLTAEVGHSDGLGPGASNAPPYNSWNAAHVNGSCADTAPKGGAGRLYCFAIN